VPTVPSTICLRFAAIITVTEGSTEPADESPAPAPTLPREPTTALLNSREERTMIARTAEAEWSGALRDGEGRLALGSGAFAGPFSFRARFEGGSDTNPEELLGAAHASCFTMALASRLTTAGHPPTHIRTTARVHLDRVEVGYAITLIELHTGAVVPGIDAAAFRDLAEDAKQHCPVSQALAGTTITLEATLD
jgi:osmotically inducible protein OsmC